jgi:uncharacterized membrane protein YtjA (UPF0391 family)
MGYFAWSLIFLLFAIVAGLFGYSGIASASAGASKVIFYILLVIFAGLLITGIVTRGAIRT